MRLDIEKLKFLYTKFAFQGVTLLFSIKYNSGVIVGGKTMNQIKLYFKPGSHSLKEMFGFDIRGGSALVNIIMEGG